jgi:Ca2+/Na+ antiporter
MSGGGGAGNLWKYLYGAGMAINAAAFALEKTHTVEHGVVLPAMLAVGGLATIFGSCEAMILGVEGLGARAKWNPFVAGTVAGLASNVPEIIMIGFVIAAEPRVAFVVTCLTLHVNALVFGVYSAMLPKDDTGQARLPEAITRLGADLIACAAGLFLAVASLMITLRLFDAGDHRGEGLGVTDLYVIGVGLLAVQVVSVFELMRNFAKVEAPAEKPGEAAEPEEPPPSVATIAGYGALGMIGSLVGGHAVGDFADALVGALTRRGVSEMVGAIIVSLFSGIASYLMIASAHVKGKYDIALSNVSGAVTQMPFVVLPFTMIIMAALAQLRVIPRLAHGAVLAIDMETTSVLLFAFPTLFLLRQAVTDGKVNRLETTIMVVVFGLIIYFLAYHG